MFTYAWLRSLKEPIITDSCYESAVYIGDCTEAGSKDPGVASQIATLINELPEYNRFLLNHLCHFLTRIDPDASKMTSNNLAIVFAPCLLRHPDLQVALANSRREIAFTQFLLEHWSKEVAETHLNLDRIAHEAEMARQALLVETSQGHASAARKSLPSSSQMVQKDSELSADRLQVAEGSSYAEPAPEPSTQGSMPCVTDQCTSLTSDTIEEGVPPSNMHAQVNTSVLVEREQDDPT